MKGKYRIGAGVRSLCATVAMVGVLAEAAADNTGNTTVLIDDVGQTVSRRPVPQRIVTLAPHLTELVIMLGARDRLVGVTGPLEALPEPLDLPLVGDAFRIDEERLLAVKPDLVLAWASGNGADTLAKLNALGLRSFVLESETLPEIAGAIRRLGQLLQTPGAEAHAQAYEQALRQLRATYADREPVRVFYQIWPQPVITVGRDLFMHEIIELCGGRNLFADVPGKAVTVSTEAVLAREPQVILSEPGGPDPFGQWQAWPVIPAVRDGQLHLLSSSTLSIPTPRLLIGAQELCERLEQVRRARYPARRGPSP